MGLFKTTNETHSHYHVSDEAARLQYEAAEEEADARRYQARTEKEALEKRLKFEEKMRLLEKDPELYKAFVMEEKLKEKKEKRKKRRRVVFVILFYIIMLAVLLIYFQNN